MRSRSSVIVSVKRLKIKLRLSKGLPVFDLLPPTQDLLDYEVDSDDEWEEEEPGESLSHSEGVSVVQD